MTLIEALLKLPPTGTKFGFAPADLYAALDAAVPTGYVHKECSRGETWWNLTDAGSGLLASSGQRTKGARLNAPGAVAAAEADHHHRSMFLVTEADADAIREVFARDGELSAAIEVRRRFPGITDNSRARQCARSIAGWQPSPEPSATVTKR